MGTPTGERDRRIELQRQGASIDDGYTSVPGGYAKLWRGWAAITYGSGREQREAAQESAVQTATFKVLANSMTRALLVTDRLCYPVSDPDPAKWPAWDVQAFAEGGRNDEVWITATRNV